MVVSIGLASFPAMPINKPTRIDLIIISLFSSMLLFSPFFNKLPPIHCSILSGLILGAFIFPAIAPELPYVKGTKENFYDKLKSPLMTMLAAGLLVPFIAWIFNFFLKIVPLNWKKVLNYNLNTIADWPTTFSIESSIYQYNLGALLAIALIAHTFFYAFPTNRFKKVAWFFFLYILIRTLKYGGIVYAELTEFSFSKIVESYGITAIITILISWYIGKISTKKTVEKTIIIEHLNSFKELKNSVMGRYLLRKYGD